MPIFMGMTESVLRGRPYFPGMASARNFKQTTLKTETFRRTSSKSARPVGTVDAGRKRGPAPLRRATVVACAGRGSCGTRPTYGRSHSSGRFFSLAAVSRPNGALACAGAAHKRRATVVACVHRPWRGEWT